MTSVGTRLDAVVAVDPTRPLLTWYDDGNGERVELSGATLANWPVPFAAVALGGMAGALADSILGGLVQARRWCDLCAKSTERLVHSCGTPTRQVGGIAGFDNDLVNAVCSGFGALVALLLL